MSDAVARPNAALEGRYAIERELGEGGMATVYLAKDLKHNRNVALKVLKPELAAVVGAERFLAEIETTANLTHPHILPLHDSGEADGFLFYVMPHIEGESLRERIDREKQLGVDDALAITQKVAGALDYAHGNGVVHRDIKPGNILLSEQGEPLVADFGIALAVAQAGAGRITETGLSLGTPHYMSPEQATGDRDVDPRSDVYALGCVLYEMLAGQPPFSATTAQAVLVKILTADAPSITSERRTVPPHVGHALARALEKLPADRFTSASEFASALADPSFTYEARARTSVAVSTPEPVATPPTMSGPWNRSTMAFAALFALTLGWSLFGPEPPEPVRGVERFAVPFLEGQEHSAYLGPSGFDLSPDGSMLVYRYDAPGGQILMVRRWDDLAANPVRETTDATAPAVSFDGLELAFEQDRNIRVLAFSGGPVRTLTPGSQPEWGPDGYVYATTDSGAVRVPSTGGAVEYVSRLGEGETAHFVRDVLPGGRRVLLEVARPDGSSEMRGLDVGSGETTPLVEGTFPRYVPSGHLVYRTTSGTMMAARFDPRRMELLGTPIAVMDGLTSFSLADDGKLYYAAGVGGTGASGPTLQLAWVTRTGQASAVDPEWIFSRGVDQSQGWSLSPEGSRVALRESTQAGYDIWIKQLDAGPRSRLTFEDAAETMPVWEPGGRDVTFLSNRNGNFDVWSKPADGTGEAELILDLDDSLFKIEWSPDGAWLLLQTVGGDVLGYRPGEDGEPTPLLEEAYFEGEPAVSPDGRWIAYASDETGRLEVYVRPFPDVGAGRWQVSSQGGRSPGWAHGGRELYFSEVRGGGGAMWVVEVESAASFTHGTPAVLFESPVQWYYRPPIGNPYDIFPDDQRFLIATQGRVDGGGQDGDLGQARVLVNNFFEELKRMVPN